MIEPPPNEQPNGTTLVIEFRGATGISGKSSDASQGYAFDANQIDPYGDVRDADTSVTPPLAEFLGDLNGDITFLNPTDPTWQADIDLIDGSKFVQMRATFTGDTTPRPGKPAVRGKPARRFERGSQVMPGPLASRPLIT